MLNHSLFNHISTFIFDVDGVFTNSTILVTDNGELLRSMNTRDGQAVKYALEAGFKVFVITKGTSPGVRQRFEMLGVTEIFDKVREKSDALQKIQEEYQIKKEEILFMGDDIPDLLLFESVGISSCPSDSANDVLSNAMYISPLEGGKGCVREIIERVMRIQEKWVI